VPGIRKRFGSLPPSRRLIRDRTTGELRPSTDDEAQAVKKASAEWFQDLLDADLLPGFPGAQEIAAKLQADAQDLLPRRQIQKTPSRGMTILGVSYLLATLRVTKPENLPRVVDSWLKWLEIEQISKPRGRPKGRQAETKHYLWFTIFRRIIEETPVWSGKQELKRQHPHDWKTRLREVLLEHRWKPEDIEYVIRSKSPRSCALYLAAKHLEVSYDVIRRSIQRRSRSQS
jgi:hypothetical protein